MRKYEIKRRALSEAQMIYPKFNFSGNLREKSYLIGFRIGDLNVVPAKKQIQVRCSTSKTVQVDLFKNLFNKYTHITVKSTRFIKEQRIYDMSCLVNYSFKFLLKKEDNIDHWILNKKHYFFPFLAGYIDAEGHIFARLCKRSKTPTAGVEIQSYDKNILHQIFHSLNKFGIKCREPKISRVKGYTSKSGVTSRGDLWRLSINRKKDLYLLFIKIEKYMKHKKRVADLKNAKLNILLRGF